MSPPDTVTIDTALAALTGKMTERKPETDLDRNLLRLRLVAEAKMAGVPWTAIGNVLGVSGKQAKHDMKALARVTQRQLLASGRGSGDDTQGPHGNHTA